MLNKAFVASVLVVGLLASGAAFAANTSPTPDQIYRAAQSGKLAQAEQMVGQVLQAHPHSGKAHYVAAEVYARAGAFATARHELAEAQALEPGLPFAQAQSVRALEAELAQGRFVQRAQRMPYAPYAASGTRHSRGAGSWGLLLLLVVGGVVVWAIVRRRRQALYGPYPGQLGMPQSGASPMGMGGGVVPPYPYGYNGAPGSGGIMRGIGTGLAMGAGMAAGEALVDRMISGSPNGGGGLPAAQAEPADDPSQVNPDLGGNDFGLSDPGSWDDGGAGGADFGAGGDDWT